jgi:hypothetical protein
MSFDYLSVTVCRQFSDGPYFHSIDLATNNNTTSDIESLSARVDNAGWEIVSVVVHYDGYAQEMVTKMYKPDYFELLDFFDLLCDNIYQADSIVAYINYFGFAEVNTWDDSIKYSSDSKAGLAQQWESEMGEKLYKEEYNPKKFTCEYVNAEIPKYLVIDWTNTADVIAANENMSITHLNGTWYMFS